MVDDRERRTGRTDPAFPDRLGEAFWTNLTWLGDWGGSAWHVDFTTGHVMPANKGGEYWVRCIRDAPPE